MIKKFLMLVLLVGSLFSYDATVEIVKKMDKLPKIAIQDASKEGVDFNFRQKFFRILKGDLRVSSHFQVVDEYFESTYDGSIEENFLSEKNLDLILRYKIIIENNGYIIAKVKLLNAKSGQVESEKIYKISKINRYPFLAHKITVELNEKIGAPSIKWMEQFVIFAKYTKIGRWQGLLFLTLYIIAIALLRMG